MDLHVTLAAGPGVQLPGGGTTEELVVTRAHLLNGKQLHEQLSHRTGAQNLTTEGTPLTELEPGVPPLTSGAVIVAANGPMGAVSPRLTTLVFLVRSGPDAGKSVPLSRGVYTIGRSTADIIIHDPELSRVHAVLTVTNDALILRDRKSANGVSVDGIRVERCTLTTGSDIHIGSSHCVVVLADTPHRPPLGADLSEPCEIGAPPPPEGNRLLILTAFLPLILGIVLAVTTGMWFFLAFSALSAVTGLVPLITGQRKRRTFDAAVAAAVTTDSERRRRAAPDAGALALAASGAAPAASGGPSPLHSSGKYLRLGIADQPANIFARPKPSDWQPPSITGAPVLVPLAEPGSGDPLSVDVRGPQQTLTHVAHLLLLQLSSLRPAGGILCFGKIEALPPAARFLPRVVLVSHRMRFAELLATGRYSTVLLFEAGPVAKSPGMRIYRFSSSTESAHGPWTIDYSGPEPALLSPDGTIRFQPDLIRRDTFELIARAIGTRTPSVAVAAAEAAVPESVALPELIRSDSASIAQRWRAPSNGLHLSAGVGSSAAGPLSLDLVTDGPHLLIAGTTGSGKSEFLRTLVLGLALNHSPADLNFLFIDFKGGSGLGALASLPHVTGMITDLSAAAVTRALVSLKAEVQRREALFASVGAADYLEFRMRTSTPVPRFVTVIDEFRVLSEEVPGSVHELMRIATLGRSLGMHLVLATQRPQGSITSEIRANITTSVALRMQSAMESQDVLESAAASSIPVNLPGRGFVRTGSGQPIEFQAATTTNLSDASLSVSIATLSSYLTQGSGTHTSALSAGTSGQSDAVTADGLQVLVAAVINAAQALPLPTPRQPVCPPLPSALTRPTAGRSEIPLLGLLDLPENQEQRPLVWSPESHSHLGVMGQPGSRLGKVLLSVAAEHLRVLPDGHIYVLDGDSNLRGVKNAPQVGAYVAASDVRRAARVLERIAETVADRLNEAAEVRKPAPHITVFVSGWGRWATAFRSSRFAWAEDALQAIVRDGEAAGATVVIAGERELIASRFFSMLASRLYLPLGATSEALLGWPKLPAMDPLPGRAFVQGRVSADGDAVAQLFMDDGPVPVVLPAERPFPVAALPHVVSSALLEAAAPGLRPLRIPIGVGGDDLGPVNLTLPHRAAALVVGGAGTGKSQTLDLIAQLAPSSVNCVRPDRGMDPATFWEQAATMEAESNELLLIDDADLLPRAVHQRLAGMLESGARAVFAASPSATIATSPALTALRISPLGIVLGPRSPTDGDVFGVRIEVAGTPPPGRGVLIESSRSMEIQVAKCDGTVARQRRGPT